VTGFGGMTQRVMLQDWAQQQEEQETMGVTDFAEFYPPILSKTTNNTTKNRIGTYLDR
jgi:hypothetical protein